MAHVVLALDVGAKVARPDSRVQRPDGVEHVHRSLGERGGPFSGPADVEALPNPAAPPVPGSPAVGAAAAPAATATVAVRTYLLSATPAPYPLSVPLLGLDSGLEADRPPGERGGSGVHGHPERSAR